MAFKKIRLGDRVISLSTAVKAYTLPKGEMKKARKGAGFYYQVAIGMAIKCPWDKEHSLGENISLSRALHNLATGKGRIFAFKRKPTEKKLHELLNKEALGILSNPLELPPIKREMDKMGARVAKALLRATKYQKSIISQANDSMKKLILKNRKWKNKK